MNNIAQFSPLEFVSKLYDLQVPGYAGYPGGIVSITSYLSANAMFGGNSKAGVLSAALRKIAAGKPESGLTRAPGFDRVFTGQGSRDNMIAAMTIINKYKNEFKSEQSLAKYFKQTDFLQAMIDDACFGLDCIGFVGTYLVDAGLETNYVGRRPLDYTAIFAPVRSLDEIQDYSAVMLTNGLHIQIINTVRERKNDRIVVDLCQSSKGGPQVNLKVTLKAGGGNYLPVEEFRAALGSKKYAQEHAESNAARAERGEKAQDYETFLRAKLTQKGTSFGYCGGAIFQLSTDGENPVGGSVYVGVANNKQGIYIRTPRERPLLEEY